MNPHIRLFSHTISDGNISMTIEGGSNFNNSNFPLYLMVGDTTWATTLDDAIAITRAAKFIARRIFYAHKRGELARAGAVFRRKLQSEGGKPLVVELGLAEGGEVDTVYFHFDQKRLTIPIVPIGGVDQLFAAFEIFRQRRRRHHPRIRATAGAILADVNGYTEHENFNNRGQPNAAHFGNRPELAVRCNAATRPESVVNRKCSAHAQYDVVDPLRKRHLGPLRKTKRKRRSVFIPLRSADALEWDRCKPMSAYPPGWLSSATLSGKRFPPDPGSGMVSNSLTIWKLGLQGRRRAVDSPMQIVCPSCATSYDVEPASRPLKGRPVRCLRCRTVWCAETPCQTMPKATTLGVMPCRLLARSPPTIIPRTLIALQRAASVSPAAMLSSSSENKPTRHLMPSAQSAARITTAS